MATVSELLDELFGLNTSDKNKTTSTLDEILNANSVLKMNENSDLIADEVLILARTKMNNQHVCVGGYSLQQKRYVRLLTFNEHYLNETEPYQVGEVYEITYQGRQNIVLPHSEDVCVLDSHLRSRLARQQLLGLISEICVHDDIHIRDLFDGKLCWEHGSGFLMQTGQITQYSVMIARLNHDLFLYDSHGSVKFRYIDNGSIFSVKYVGVGNINSRKIPMGRYLRFSLARWWDNNGCYPTKRAYLQLSGIY